MVLLTTAILVRLRIQLMEEREVLDMKVESIIDQEERRCNIELIQNMLTKEESEAIKAIVLPSRSKEDRRIWPLTKYGDYTVKTQYFCSRRNLASNTSKKASSSP